MLNEAIAFIAKHFKGSDPQHSVIQEQKRFMKYGTDWHDVLRQAREGRGKMTQSQQYHVLGIDMYRQKLEHERRQRGMASAIQRGKKPTSREASPEPPPMPAPQGVSVPSTPPPPRPQQKLVEARPQPFMRQITRTKTERVERAERAAARGISVPVVDERAVRQQRRRTLVAQPTSTTETEHTSYTHLIEGDLAPVGRVHLVSLGPDVGDQRTSHFMTQMDADANMGANNLRHTRRGPFKTSTGRSRVMDRSRHVAYRRRGHAMEITVRRGVTDYEMETLIGKLSAHRISSQHADLFLIASSRKNLGDLDRIDMGKLRDRIYTELQKRATIGLLLQDRISKGILHKGYSHSMTFRENTSNLLKSALFAK
jgi:hypothetical protein